MAVHYNSISRLLVYIDAILALPDDISTLEGWARVFGINEPRERAVPYRVAELLVVAEKELGYMERSLEANGSLGPDLYAEPINYARNCFSPSMLAHPTNQVKVWLRDYVKTPFRYMVPSMNSEVREFETDDLLELNVLIAKLQDVIAVSTLDPAVAQVVRDHIALLLRALTFYPISGPRAFSDAMRQMAVELYVNKDALNENIDLPEVGLLRQTFIKLRSMVETANAAGDFVSVVCLAWDAGKKILTL